MMKAEWINPLVSSAFQVLKTFGFGIEREGLKLQGSPIVGNEVNVAIGITGDLQGQVIVGMETDTALLIARGMIPWEVPEFDEMARSSIAELSNMLCGNASANFSQIGLATNLSVPSMFIGRDVVISTGSNQSLVLPLRIKTADGQTGKVSLTVVFREKAGAGA